MVTSLQKELAELRGKCEDMEGRMWRFNILGVPEELISSSTMSVSKLLIEMLGMDKDLLVDCSHRSLMPKRQDRKPRAIVAKLHYYQDCVEILRQAQSQAPLWLNRKPIAIFLEEVLQRSGDSYMINKESVLASYSLLVSASHTKGRTKSFCILAKTWLMLNGISSGQRKTGHE